MTYARIIVENGRPPLDKTTLRSCLNAQCVMMAQYFSGKVWYMSLHDAHLQTPLVSSPPKSRRNPIPYFPFVFPYGLGSNKSPKLAYSRYGKSEIFHLQTRTDAVRENLDDTFLSALL